MKRIIFTLTISMLALASCNHSSNNYIVPVDYESYYEGVTSLTEKEGQELSQKIIMDWFNNTRGKEIPDIQVKNLDGRNVKIKKLLKRATILVFTDTHCGFGKEEVESEFPMAISNMKEEFEGIDVLCLVEDAEDSAPDEALNYAKSLQGIYDNVFIIDQKDAIRMNLTGSPTKFFIDKHQIVRHIQMGFDMDDDRREDNIRQAMELMKKG